MRNLSTDPTQAEEADRADGADGADLADGADRAGRQCPGSAVSVVIVGAGPRGSGLLERLIANVPELLPGRPITVHMVGPHPFGAGRIWRHQQSALLWANSMAQDMTMFTDDSCTVEGPIRPGPTFVEWARRTRSTGFLEPSLDAELAGIQDMSFPSRRLLTEYLAWTFWRTVDAAPANVTVHVHPDRVLDVTDDPGHGRLDDHRASTGQDAGSRQLVQLEHATEPLIADVVLLAMGHLSTLPLGPSAELATGAERHGLVYLPEEYTADSDLSVLTPGQDVLVRGAGLAFIDLLVLVTQGRGGSFTEAADGTLSYLPSGREPRLHVGSRRGVPYHCKPIYRLQGEPAPHPRFLDGVAVDRLLARDGELDFRADIWPLVAKELAFGHYHELFGAHPERARMA
ncbi:MAG TPA: FAD/NAD(P)-binding protein, partial [Kineosporiaceae bacterium]|nr:FAD/NAD(P)-binding protein [Kineosporiaceae bacterium]